MKKIIILLLICFFALTNTSLAQYVITKLWDKTLGGNIGEGGCDPVFGAMANYNVGRMVLSALPNGNIVVCGVSFSGISGDKTQSNWLGGTDTWLVAVDSASGQKTGDYRFGGVSQENVADFAVLPSGNYFLTIISDALTATGDYSIATTGQFSSNLRVRYLLLDSGFTKIWDRVIEADAVATRMVWRNNQYYMLFYGQDLNLSELTDTLCDGENNNDVQIGLAVYDSSGTIAWDHLYSGGTTSGYNRAYGLLPIDNNEYILSGFSSDSITACELTDISAGKYDGSVFKIDSVGDVIWHRCFGGTGTEESRGDVLPTTDGNFIFSAVSNSPQGGELSQPNSSQGVPYTDSLNLWIVKFDSNGSIIWDKRFGGCYSTMKYCKAINTLDGGFLIGTTIGRFSVSSTAAQYNAQDSIPGCDVSEYGRGLADYWLLKLDSAGNKQWDKRWGGSERDGFEDVIQLSDGSYVVAGTSFSSISGDKTEDNRDTSHVMIGTVSTPRSTDYWVVRFRADLIVGSDEQWGVGNLQLAISPNPAKDNCTITIAVTNATLTLYDITGRVLLQQPFNNKTTIDVSQLSSGVYIAEVKDKYGRSSKGKLVKQE